MTRSSKRWKKKPVGWPKYMKARRLAGHRTGYYWVPRPADLERGFPYGAEALGDNYGVAVERANLLNRFLDAWRAGQKLGNRAELDRRFGTLSWLFEQYRRSPLFLRVSPRSKPEYERALRRIEDLPTTNGKVVGDLAVSSISPRAVDKIYERLQMGPRGKRIRQANLSIDIARRAWAVVYREHSSVVPAENPFRGTPKILSKRSKPAATREEAYALAHALRDLGEPHLGAAAIIAFEWLQRPENILAGAIKWSDYRPPDRPEHVRVFHAKTNEVVWLPLADEQGLLYPELEAYLSGLPRLGTPIVLTNGTRGPSRPYAQVYAQSRVRQARKAAGLGDHVTVDACRHGGMTELGDAEIFEQGVMALSGHRTPAAARGYVKRTETQRIAASRKRRDAVNAMKHAAEGHRSSNRKGLPPK